MIDSKKLKTTINVDSIDTFRESKDGRINVVYYLPSKSKDGPLLKKNQSYEVCESDILLKIFNAIENNHSQSQSSRS